MSKKKQLMFIMPVMKGGGAEKVAALLLNEFNKNGYECELVLTNSDRDEIVDRGLNPEVSLTVLREKFTENGIFKKIFITLFKLFTSIICKVPEALGQKVPAVFARLSFKAQYYDELNALKKHFRAKPDAVILSFLQPSIPLTLLAAECLPNRVVVSERADPYRLLKKRYGYNFIRKYYQRANAVVFQTNDAKAAYPENISKKGTVIFNPINNSLPEPYHGERDKYVTTFCRISRQKNLPVLVEAFADFHKNFSDYRLKIIGEPQNDDDRESLNETKALADKLGVTGYIDFMPFSSQVHNLIINDAMYVNSSDYEGMSNAMLEAMAIGMPVVCTDCPIGGANAVIQHNQNGILTQVGNAEEMCAAMKKIASDKAFADSLSHNAAQIKLDLSLENTAKKWMELL
ncbi:MAG: glycosyltransferase [Clostridia bacterium]|nr:glycosyltransferase [Clostridia bacterium]